MVTRQKGLPLVQQGPAYRRRPRRGRELDPRLLPDARLDRGEASTSPRHGRLVAGPARRRRSRSSRGRAAFVTERQVVGAEQLDPAEVDKLLIVEVGEPFNPSAVRQDVQSLTTWYRNNGWPEAVGPGPLHALRRTGRRRRSSTAWKKGCARSSARRSSAATPSRTPSGSCGRSPGRRASPSPRRRSPTPSRTCRAPACSGRSRSSRSRPSRRTRSATSPST